MKTVLSISLWGFLWLSMASYAAPKPYTLAFAANPPFSMTDNGRPQGIAINIISVLFEQAHIPYQLVEVPLVRAMMNAKTTENYCAFPVQRSQNIEADYQWISPILMTRSGLFARPDFQEQLLTLSDAKKMKVGVLRGSGDADYLKSFGFTVEEANTQAQNIDKLLAKRFDLWATDVLSANFFIQKRGKAAAKEVLTFRATLSSLACQVDMNKGDLATLQETLDRLIKEGVLQKLTATVQ
jgi:hypothetical protein